jgi:hypothetical protein
MHNLMLVTINKDCAENSQEAREYVNAELMNDNSFVGDNGGRFGTNVCDYFSIGGRWTGELQMRLMDKDFYEEVEKELKKATGKEYITSEDRKKYMPAIQSLWKLMGGKGDNPYTNEDPDNGNECDAMIVTKKIYEKILKNYEGMSQGDDWDFVDLDYDCVNKDFIGRKWIVVVDFHN